MDAIVGPWNGSAARLGESLAAVRSVFRNPNLRRIELAYGGSAIGNYAFSVAIAIYAFHQGGVAAVGIVTAVRQAAAASIAPFAASRSDRFRRERVMLVSDAGRIGCTGGIAISSQAAHQGSRSTRSRSGRLVFGAVSARPRRHSSRCRRIAAGTDRGQRDSQHVRQRRRLRRPRARRVL